VPAHGEAVSGSDKPQQRAVRRRRERVGQSFAVVCAAARIGFSQYVDERRSALHI
jgi:hypothetical protein